MQNLQKALDVFSAKHKFHICIVPYSNLFGIGLTKIKYSSQTHSMDFCNYAKSTKQGFRLCFACKKKISIKNAQNERAVCRDMPIWII